MFASDLITDAASGPLITIAIPTFNRASWLKECVLSVLSQTYQHFEVVVSDNASTDETPDILKQFVDKRLRVKRQEANIGLFPNWNACLAEARGDYIIFVSDDDRVEPWLLERCVSLVCDKQSEITIVLALSDTFSTKAGRTWPARASRRLGTGVWDGVKVLSEYLEDQVSVNMCSIMLRTKELRAQGGFRLDLPHTGDVAACAALLLKGKAGLVNEVCATYFTHSKCETALLGAARCLRDGWSVAAFITDLANASIDDPRQRRDIQMKSRRCFGRRGLIMLYSFRKDGGTLSDVLALLWRFRGDFNQIGLKNLLVLRRRIAFMLCPKLVANCADRARKLIADRTHHTAGWIRNGREEPTSGRY